MVGSIAGGRAGIVAVVIALSACSSNEDENKDAATGTVRDAASEPSDDGGLACDGRSSSGAGVFDIAPDRTMPDPDDPSCLLPPPEPPQCWAPCAVRWSPDVECVRPQSSVCGTGGYDAVMQADAQGVYWTVRGFLRMARTGTMTRIGEELAYVGDEFFAIDDDAVYFGSPADSGDVTLTRMKRDGTERVALAQVGPSSRYVVDHDSVYFNAADGRLTSVPKSGGTPVDLGVGEASAYALEVDDTHLYWLALDPTWTADGGARFPHRIVRRMAKGTTTIETFASDLGYIRKIEQQGDSILVLANGVFLSLPKAGGCPLVLAAYPVDISQVISSFVADERAIYWLLVGTNSDQPSYQLWRTSRGGGAVVKVGPYGNALGSSIALAPSQVYLRSDLDIGKIDRN